MQQKKDTKKSPELSSRATDLAYEQAYVTMLYEHLDAKRAAISERLTDVRRGPTVETDQANYERESFHGLYTEEAARLDAVERGLCFGRLDFEDDDRLYIGRIGLHDHDHEPILVDWRAPAALPFYRATPIERHGVVLRRHLHTKEREVVEIDDDVLDLASIDDSKLPHLTGEAALLASLNRGRSGRMSDIVATIQTEQDTIIRSDLKGILVVEGGPGTGKTVVALHRAAYLLYTHRERLRKRGILVIGPSATFVRYIDRVLPSLGETEVVLATMASLYPGVHASATESPAAATIKGDAYMIEVVAKAVENRQRVPDQPLPITVDHETYVLDPEVCAGARETARQVRDPVHSGPETHNRRRPVFVRAIIDELTRQAVRRHGADLLEEHDIAALRAEIRTDPAVHHLLDDLWPELTPQRLLGDLFSNADQLAAAAPQLTEGERPALLRTDPDATWSPADVPLLDEAAELLGPLDIELYSAAHGDALRAAEHDEDRRYAEEVIDHLREGEALAIDDDDDARIFAGYVVGDYATDGPHRPLAERAPEDREWTYGHVIIDEAQELSAMDWRMLMRRCPARSMTVVGDPAQCSAPGGSRSWNDTLDVYASGRWRTERLSLNYRTPTTIMALAADVLAAADPSLAPPRSVRETTDHPRAYATTAEQLVDDVAALAEHELTAVGDGRVAIIVPATAPGLRANLGTAIPDAQDRGAGMLDAPVAIMSPMECKGLEFDSVLIVDPALILREAPRGLSDLYVALTRTTRRLGVVHLGPLPTPLRRLEPRPGTRM